MTEEPEHREPELFPAPSEMRIRDRGYQPSKAKCQDLKVRNSDL